MRDMTDQDQREFVEGIGNEKGRCIVYNPLQVS